MSPADFAVVFDLDGTLVDTALDIGAALGGVMSAAGLSPCSEDEVRSWVGDGGAMLLRRAWRARGLPLDPEETARRLDHFRALYAERPLDRSQPYPGMVATLEELQSAGHPLAVCTNKPRQHTDLVLAGLNLQRWFRAVVAGDDLPVRKPNPEHLRVALRGAGTQQGLLIGDGPADLGAARQASIPFVAVSWGYGPRTLQDEAQAVCATAAEIPATVARLQARSAD